MTNLLELTLNNNQIIEISALSGLNSLEILFLENNLISDLNPLSGKTQLVQLWLHNNLIIDIGALAGLINLEDDYEEDGPGLRLQDNFIDVDPDSAQRLIIDTLNAISGLTVEFEPQNLPVANDDATSVNEGGTVTILGGGATSVLANDLAVETDILTVNTTPISGPNHGTLILAVDGTFTYTHDGLSLASDSFVYEISDGTATATATVAINILSSSPSPRWESDIGAALGLGDDETNISTFGTFSFPFAGTTHTGSDVLSISSNGFISLGGDNGSDYSSDPTELVEEVARIAPLWTDLAPETGDDVYLNTFANDDADPAIDRVVVTWDTATFWSDSPVRIQLQLLEDGTIIMGYDNYIFTVDDDENVLIGISPGGFVTDPGSSDYTASAPFDSGTEPTIYEFFEYIPPPPVDIAEDSNIIFQPNGSGGFNVTIG